MNMFVADEGASRVVDVSEKFLAVVPYAGSGPYVITILPWYGGDGEGGSGTVDCSDFTSCAAVLHSCMRCLYTRCLMSRASTWTCRWHKCGGGASRWLSDPRPSFGGTSV